MKKYAIYKSVNGYYYYRYCDTPESLEDTAFKGIIPVDRLPVVLDGKGGYYRFRDDEMNFTKIIESDEEIPLTLEEMFFKNDENFKLGWMSPNGDTYSCDFTSHNKAAKMLAEKFYEKNNYPERTLGRNGWLQIIDSWNGTERQHSQFVYSLSGKITSKQADKLFDVGLYDNPEVRELISSNENDW